jgi:hypothetical protein
MSSKETTGCFMRMSSQDQLRITRDRFQAVFDHLSTGRKFERVTIANPYGEGSRAVAAFVVNEVCGMLKEVNKVRAASNLPAISEAQMFRLDDSSTGADYHSKFPLRCARVALGLDSLAA